MVFEYERDAMAGKEMPYDLKWPDQVMYSQLRLLYNSFQKGLIDRETAKNEKNNLEREYEWNLKYYGFCEKAALMMVETESALMEYERNKTATNAEKIVQIIKKHCERFDK